MVFGSAGECVFGLFPYFEQMTILGAILIRKKGGERREGKKERKERKKGPPRRTKQSCSKRELSRLGDPGQAVTGAETSVPKLFLQP